MHKVYFKRLPKPYDTECMEYDNNNRFECINNCFKIKYNNRFGCIPSENSLFTFKLDDHINFCNESFFINLTLLNSAIESSCYQLCRSSCNEHSFEVDIKKTKILRNKIIRPIRSFFIAMDIYYTKIKYSPSLEFGDLIINLTNIWSLWHGMSFITIVIELFGLIKKFSTKISHYFGPKLSSIVQYFRQLEFNANLKVNIFTILLFIIQRVT